MENLKALVYKGDLTPYQKALAQREFKDMVERLELLEKIVKNNAVLPLVSNRRELLLDFMTYVPPEAYATHSKAELADNYLSSNNCYKLIKIVENMKRLPKDEITWKQALNIPVVSESVCKHVFTAYDNTIDDYRCIWCGLPLKQTVR